MNKPRILFAMIKVGNGHIAPARALQSGLEHLYPDAFASQLIDFSAELGDHVFDKQHKASWDWMLAHPKITYWGQRVLDTVIPVNVVRFIQGMALDKQAKQAVSYINTHYDLVIATHFFAVQALARAKKYGLSVPLIGLLTDPFDAHAMWAEPQIDEMIVASELAKRKLVNKGVPPQKVNVLGYPLGLDFTRSLVSKTQARAELGLNSKLCIFHSAGGEGISSQLERAVHAVLNAELDIQYIVACGRNKPLYQRLSKLALDHNGPTQLIPKGFITNMHTWITASDIVLGKAGAASTLEALSLGRPIFHTSYASYNEKTNIDYCEHHKLGHYLPNAEAVVTTLKRLITEPEYLDGYNQAIADLDFQSGTLNIAKHIAKTYFPTYLERKPIASA